MDEKKRRKLFLKIVKGYANGLIKTFKDKKNRGPKFEFKDLPKIVGRISDADARNYFSIADWKPEYTVYIKKLADIVTKALLKEEGLI